MKVQGQVESLRSRLTVQQLDQFVRSLRGLSPVGLVAGRALALATGSGLDGVPSNGADAEEEFADLARLDPSLTAGLLALANRRGGRGAATVAGAVEKIGFDAVWPAVLSGQVFQLWAWGQPNDSGLDGRAFWKHCLAVAAAAEMLVGRMNCRIDPPEAFVAGLLHDIGKLVLSQGLPKTYRRAVDAAVRHNGNIGDYERDIIGVDHSVAGLHLARYWRLGGGIESVTWLAHQAGEAIPEAIEGRMLVEVVTLADAIARDRRVGFSGNFTFPRSPKQLAERLGISPDGLAEISDAVAKRVEDYVDRFAPQWSGGGEATYRGLLMEANSRLGKLNEQLSQRAETLAGRAGAFERVREFAGSILPDASVFDVLGRVATIAAAGAGVTPTPAEPLVTYCVGRGNEEVTLVRSAGGQAPTFMTCGRNPRFEAEREPVFGTSAAAMMSSVLDDTEPLSEWVDLSSYLHRPLVCGGRWIGGVLYPGAGGGAGSDRLDGVFEALGEMIALALAMTQAKSCAVRLSEQLAGASEVLAGSQDALAEVENLAVVGEMAAGAGHELNNPLTVISGRAQLMCERADSEEERTAWRHIADQCQKISDIISDLMDFASPPEPRAAAQDVAELLGEVVASFRASDHRQSQSAAIDVAGSPDGLAMMADRGQVHAALLELVTNAATAAEGTPNIRLAAEVDEIDNAVLLTVSDSGPGMASDTLAKAFTPFFSAQAAGRRRGLGLPRARRYVVNNGGRMWIKTLAGEGTTVYVQLRRAGK
ncbi:MAG: HDOD domain-containing protein [Phycisphaerae bacterium]|nr:HDOD domain-containing protein [Phycisphaerae bacterium]